MRFLLVAALVAPVFVEAWWWWETQGTTRDITTEQKNVLRQNWGVDPDQRKQRLADLGTKNAPPALTEQQKKELQTKLNEILHVVTQKPTDDTPVDLFDVNNKAGISQYLYTGDVFLTESQLSALENKSARKKRQMSKIYKKWTNNLVPYFFDPSLDDRKKASVVAATEYIQSKTCVSFVEDASATNRIRVYSGSGCFSNIGMTGGQQDLSLGNGCEPMGTVAHEFTHALGSHHMQMRFDRDTYITVDTSGVQAGKEGNFAKSAESDMISPTYTPYEYGSFMQYSANAFARDPAILSMIPADTRFAYTMGSGLISYYDLKMINDHYGCSDLCPVATSAQCKNGGSPNPRNCAVCNCPEGYGGALCDTRPSSCGNNYNANSTWQSFVINPGNATSQTVRDIFTVCTSWISAPAGSELEVEITSMFNSQCQYGCPFAGIEFKTETDPKMTSPRYCCPEFNNKTITSTYNPLPVIAYNRFYYSTFGVRYRAVTPTTTTTTSTTTTTTKPPLPPIPGNQCKNMLTDVQCDGNVAEDFCNRTTEYSFQERKYNCANHCGLCGKAASPCIDKNAGCNRGLCSYFTPMAAEFWCAKTCGYCDFPN